MQTAFSELAAHHSLSTALLQAIESLGFSQMTPIQAKSLPDILAGKDVLGKAKTGSGKTLAFGLGVLNKLNPTEFCPQALVLCPTRELADQVASELRKLARCIPNVKIVTLYGGSPIGPQIHSLEHGAHIIVGTPGRIADHLHKRSLSLEALETFVLDEADRLLDMGFQEAIEDILSHAPKGCHGLLFSATFPEKIKTLGQRLLHKPITIEVDENHSHNRIKQYFYELQDNKQRITAVKLVLLKFQPQSTVIFCATRRDANDLNQQLSQEGFSCLALHSDLEQRERESALIRFANQSISLLIATDVAARGIDVKKLDMVINYHLARDSETHVHRVGRTGRSGHSGIACSFFSTKEHYKVERLQEALGEVFTPSPLPPFKLLHSSPSKPKTVTMMISAGKKQKIRAGDILGALTGDNGISGKQVGKITVLDEVSFVAIERSASKPALKKLAGDKIKGKLRKVRVIRG